MFFSPPRFLPSFPNFLPVAAQQLPYLPPILMTPIIDSSWHRCQLQYRKLSTLCWLYCQLPYRQQASPQHRLWSFKDLTPLVTTKPFSVFKGLFMIALPFAALSTCARGILKRWQALCVREDLKRILHFFGLAAIWLF